jgi:hypothetical protein
MTKPIVRIHNAETQEVIDREMTAEELTQYELYQANAALQAQARAHAATAKAALLARLGITEDEAALLLGGN